LHLAWDASNDPAVVGYRVYYGDSSAKDSARYTKSVQVEGRLTCSAVISGLKDGKTYFFAVTAFTADGKESAYSPEITCKALGAPAKMDDHPGGSAGGTGSRDGRSGAGSAGQRGRSFDETGKQPVAPHAIPAPPRRGPAAKPSSLIPGGAPSAPTPPRRGPAATTQQQSRG